MVPGSHKFYEWITAHADYYPSKRWEWGVAIDIIESAAYQRPITVLEVGCGSGEFLHTLHKRRNIKVVGLDFTESSVAICREKGIEAYCETIDSFIANAEYGSSRFDYVVAFHTLEHVDNPRLLVSSMACLLNGSGRILASTPYSPMSFETSWFDPLNHPPHHLTRWNVKAYNELSSQLGLKVEFHMPVASNVARRVLYTLSLLWNGRKAVSKSHVLKQLVAHPLVALNEIAKQFRRKKYIGRILSDVVLVELYK
jgi:SAM-dependent methyltransferase